MFMLLLVLLLIWVVLVVFVTGWSLWIQNYLYTESAEGLVWRGPAAGSAIMLVVLFWVVLAYNGEPKRWRPVFDMDASSTKDRPPFPELRVRGPDGEKKYHLMPGGKLEYKLGGSQSGENLPSRPLKIIAVDAEGNEFTFAPEMEHGKFKQRSRASSWFGSRQKEPLRYVNMKNPNEVMEEGALGRLSTFRSGTFFGNLLLSGLLLVVAFAAFWPLLRFGVGHALAHAAGLGAVLLILVLPMLLNHVERVAKERAEARRTAE